MVDKIAIIGCGNMGMAILKGIVDSDFINEQKIYLSDRKNKYINLFKNKNNVILVNENCAAVEDADCIILAVKPQQMRELLVEITSSVKSTALIISVAAGISMQFLQSFFSDNAKVVRAMPNLAASVSQSSTAVCFSENCSEYDENLVFSIFKTFGSCSKIVESQMSAVIAVSGSSPAYFLLLLDAMIEEGVKMGFREEVAKELALQTMEGVATLVRKSSYEPKALCEKVCSPNGTTIEAVKVFQQSDFSKIVSSAMQKCAKRSAEMETENNKNI